MDDTLLGKPTVSAARGRTFYHHENTEVISLYVLSDFSKIQLMVNWWFGLVVWIPMIPL